MAERAITPANVPKTYAELRKAVELALIKGQQAVEQAKVRTYWETGSFIQEHLLFNAARADYGAKIVSRLARDLNIAERTLYSCVHFVEYFPIPRLRAELTWGHYRLLCQPSSSTRLSRISMSAIWRMCFSRPTTVKST